ncbi:nitrogen fixation protein NifM [Uliginosibacterium paludis]|uniref:peptidylprolyl isomerase n=1 Tax=Uliginosibacterium paludis TaxID=1615952 RepID=A0ABV2CWI5_9RHOO
MSELASPAAAVAAASSPYLMLKHARVMFDTTPERLDAAQRMKLDQVVARQHKIEARILGSRQSTHVKVSAEAIESRLAEIGSRFSSEAEFVLDLARHGLSLQGMRAEIERELRIDGVLEMVSARIPPVSNLETELFYRLHFDRFQTPERRTLRHILLTFSDAADRTEREVVRARLEAIRALLERAPDRFAEQALRHSECPTAMQGGMLGQVARGKLFPALETAAFDMRAGMLSSIVESPMGFHLLRCENVQAAGRVPFATVRERIREQMIEARRENRQRAWIRQVTEGYV